MQFGTDTLLFKTKFIYAPFLHFMLILLSKIVFVGLQKQKGNFVFRKIDILHVWHTEPSVARNLNLMNFNNSCCNWLDNVFEIKTSITRKRGFVKFLKQFVRGNYTSMCIHEGSMLQ